MEKIAHTWLITQKDIQTHRSMRVTKSIGMAFLLIMGTCASSKNISTKTRYSCFYWSFRKNSFGWTITHRPTCQVKGKKYTVHLFNVLHIQLHQLDTVRARKDRYHCLLYKINEPILKLKNILTSFKWHEFSNPTAFILWAHQGLCCLLYSII